MRTWKVVVGVVALGISGCPRVAPPEPDAGPVAVVVDAGPRVPLAIDLVVTLADGGTERHALLGLESPVVSPSRALLVETNRPLHNVRIRVMDESDRALASNDLPEETPAALRSQIDLAAPLEPGRKYAVLVDAQSGATFDDGSGKEIPAQRRADRPRGARERPKAPPPHRKRRRP
ncbi:MAG: hypothetical protein ACXU81_05820 [Myxococcaceae bacterium]